MRYRGLLADTLPQCDSESVLEGDVQLVGEAAIDAELWELVQGRVPGRTHNREVCIFDSVGFAIEDFATLLHIDALLEGRNLGVDIDLLPTLDDPKNLYAALDLDR